MRRSFLLAVVSLLVFFALFEGVVRLVGPSLAVPAPGTHFRFDQGLLGDVPYHLRDPELGWVLKPDVTAHFDARGAGSSRGVMRTNSLGFRGGEFELQKTPGTYRIVIAGDSNAMGFGNSDENVYAVWLVELLSEELGDGAAPIETINLGVDGYTSFQTLRLLRRYVSALDPDCVCIQVGFNDHTLSPVADEEFPFARPAVLRLLEHSHAYRWLRRQVLRIVPADRPEHLVRRVDIDAYQGNVRRMIELATGSGARVVLLTTPADPSTPLLMSEVAVTENGETTWTTERAWVLSRLAELGAAAPENPWAPGYLDAARQVAAERPEWAYAQYALERGFVATGHPEKAAEARGRWQALDGERVVLESYMERLRRLAATDSVELVDVGEAIDAYAREWDVRPRELFLDFVHLDPRGQLAIARALARVIAPHVAAR